MPQSRKSSAFEALLNILIGFGVSVLANWLILPHYGVSPNIGVSFEIGLWFTLISFIRSYTLRRLFNYALHREGKPKCRV